MNRHDSAVVQIAESLLTFPGGVVFPGASNPTWATYTNVGRPSMPLRHRWEGDLYPDIVLVDVAEANRARLVAEVETPDTITEMTLDRKWKLDMDECPVFYLFVPTGYAAKAARLFLKFRTMTKLPRAMYTYDFDPLWRVRLTPV